MATRQFNTFDASEDVGDNGNAAGRGYREEKVHIRVQQRIGRQCITTVAGLAEDLDVKKICEAFKKNFYCKGAVRKDEVILLSGDQRTNVKDFLVDQEICRGESIVVQFNYDCFHSTASRIYLRNGVVVLAVAV
eukprot:scaffold26892_cov132-Cylindrotheca_fusiformis.AAC.2